MSEERRDQRGSAWRWVALAAGILLVLVLTCAVSSLWGGLLGFAIGRATAPQPQIESLPFDPFELEPYYDQPPYLSGRVWLGVYYEMEEDGARITGVITDSPADDAGIQEGDIITAVDGRPVEETDSLADLIQAYSPGDLVRLRILRDGHERTIRVRLGERMEYEIPMDPGWDG